VKAIASVSDKSGLVEFARDLVGLGVEIYSTGGTLDALQKAGVPARSVSDLTGFPEILEGRVKTLHPAVHGGILARRESPEHMAQLHQHGISTIDLVIVNLYPFTQTIERPEATLAQAVENVDVGGPTLLRAAAKNFEHVVPVADPDDYGLVLAGLEAGGIDLPTRQRLAAKAFQHTATYDTHVAGYLRDEPDQLPKRFTIALEKLEELRYGENPHQKGALYAQTPNLRRGATLVGAQQLAGRPISFTDTLDVDAALACVRDFAAMTVAVVKHGNPCGLACGDDLADTYRRAHAGDPQAAVGGCLGLNRPLDAPTARLIARTYYEDIVAPGYAEDALATLIAANKDLRLFRVDFTPLDEAALRVSPTLTLDLKRVSGGFLVQTPDIQGQDEISYRVAGAREPTLEELTNLMFAWRAVKHVRSNAVVLARRLALVGVGAGQMSRADATEIGIRKAGERAVGAVMASDAFFTAPDGVELAADAGVTAIVQPGGSIRDEEIIKAANRHHIAVVLTGYRHFKH